MPNQDSDKLKYLKREEVRTMEKDIAKLRERESEAARQKVAQIITGKETGEEAEKIEQLKRAAEERERMGMEAKKKEEELTRLKAEREKKAASAEATAAKEEEEEKEKLRTQFREAQLREEQERRKFLEDVEAKAEGREIPEERERPVPPPIPPRALPPRAVPETPQPEPVRPAPPLPVEPPVPPTPSAPPVPAIPKKPFKFPFKIPKLKFPTVRMPEVRMPKLPKFQGYFPSRPSIFEKIWIRIIISLFILAILTTIVTFWYWYLVVRLVVEEEETTTIPREEIIIPPEQKPVEITKPPIVDRILTIGYIIPDEPRTIDTIIIHSAYSDLGGDPHSIEGIIKEHQFYKVTAHYLIDREGTIYQTAPNEARAYHAGVGQMPDGRAHVNDFSIGIELINTEEESPSETQYQSLAQLIKYLQKEYNVPMENILGHKDIAEGSRTDPWDFNMEYLKSLLQ